MKEDKAAAAKLNAILKAYGMESPGASFSDQLADAIIQQHRAKAPAAFKAGKWVGKVILGVLIFFNLLFLYYLNPFAKQPALFIAVIAFIAGIWGIIAVTRKCLWPTLHDH